MLTTTKIGVWYVNSLVTSAAVTVIVVGMAAGAGYAISQLNFPGRRIFWWPDPGELHGADPGPDRHPFRADEPVPPGSTPARASSRPQLIAPITVIIYKQFFDSVPKDFREAAAIDGANEFQLLFRIYLPMNWGITDRARDHHLHRRLEPLPLAVSRGDDRRT